MTSIYRCVQCGRVPLSRSRTAFSCARCGGLYPIVFNVPFFVPRFRCEPSGFHVCHDTARALAETVGIEASSFTHFVFNQIHSYDYMFGEHTATARDNRLLRNAVNPRNQTAPNRLLGDKTIAEIDRCRRPGMRILEVGSALIASAFPEETYCVDTDVYSLQLLQFGRRHDVQRSQFHVVDFAALPFVDHSFDAVVCDPAYSDSIRHVLKPGGVVMKCAAASAPLAARPSRQWCTMERSAMHETSRRVA
jgi:hypothetical protein